jgi:hypothetical protein
MYTVMALSKSLTISTDFCQKKLFPPVACDYSVRTRVRLHDELLAGAPRPVDGLFPYSAVLLPSPSWWSSFSPPHARALQRISGFPLHTPRFYVTL